MRICLINNLYGAYARGGAEKVVSTIARGLLSAGHEVFVITTKPYFKDALNVAAGEVKVYYLNSLYYNLNKLPKFIKLFWHAWDIFNIVNYFKIKKILETEKCDAVITNNLMGVGYLTGLAIRKLKIKQIHIAHDIQLIHPAGLLYYGQEGLINSLASKNYAGILSRLLGSPRAVIFPSRWLLSKHMDKIFFVKSKRMVLPNPVADMSVGKSYRDENIFRFLFVGQLEKHKGVDLLIQAFRKVKAKFPKIELVVAGDGSEMGQLKSELTAGDNIKLLGRQDEVSVKKLLLSSDILVVPALCYENCPAVILEAFSAELPVMGADLGGISELIGKEAGILFNPADELDLANKMEWAMSHKEDLENMAKAGKAKAMLCSPENYIKKIEGLIK